MLRGSLRTRLLLAAALAIVAALTVSGVLLARLFERHVENRLATELQAHLNQLAAGLEAEADGVVRTVPALADRRFQEPYAGLYWQLDSSSGPRLRSRSLWDFELSLPTDDLPDGALHRHDIQGPRATSLLAVERAFVLGAGAGRVALRIVVAVDRKDIDFAAADFRSVLRTSLLVVGGALIATFGGMLHVGLLPLRRLESALQGVHAGRSTTVEGAFPAEVRPLVDAMNRLLDQQRRSVVRAREQAADLAHGFKTPLSLLDAIARELRRDGRIGPAQEIETQVEAMGRHVRRELARARVAGQSNAEPGGVPARQVAERIAATMRRVGGDRDLAWSVEGSADARFAGDETDLMEILGNLAENAGKWARSRVRIRIARDGDHLDLSVDDDGPGVPAGAEQTVLERGRRLDEAAEGSGLGLSIVAKAVDAYGARIELSRSPLGGLRASVRLPAAKPELTGR